MPIPPSVKIEHMAKFQLETLFYKFYALPGDVLQALAAQELYRREWRYHGELKLWMKQRSPQEVMSAADGTPPTIAFIFFDPATWEARPFNTAYRGNLTAGFLKDEDLKVSPADLKIQKS
jgi:CCR4-NOT transcription complex subunit 2